MAGCAYCFFHAVIHNTVKIEVRTRGLPILHWMGHLVLRIDSPIIERTVEVYISTFSIQSDEIC